MVCDVHLWPILNDFILVNQDAVDTALGEVQSSDETRWPSADDKNRCRTRSLSHAAVILEKSHFRGGIQLLWDHATSKNFAASSYLRCLA